MKTTLNKIRKHGPCNDVWEKLLSHLGKTKSDDEPLSISTILDSNGLEDALWCLRAVEGYDREKRLYAVWCARQVQHLMTDERSINAIDVAERFANGEVTKKELAAAIYTARADAVYADAVRANAARVDTTWTAAAWAAWATGVTRADAAASYAAYAAYAARAADAADAAALAQKTEFIRLLDCIEHGKRYEIGGN